MLKNNKLNDKSLDKVNGGVGGNSQITEDSKFYKTCDSLNIGTYFFYELQNKNSKEDNELRIIKISDIADASYNLTYLNDEACNKEYSHYYNRGIDINIYYYIISIGDWCNYKIINSGDMCLRV